MKQAVLIDMLRSQKGSTIEEIISATGRLSHGAGRVRRALKKKLGLTIMSDKVEGRGRVCRIAD